MPTKLATRSSVENIAVLDSLLSSRGGATMPRLCLAIESCEKTVRRHLNWMQRKLGVRIFRYEARGMQWWVYESESCQIFTDDVHRRLRR